MTPTDTDTTQDTAPPDSTVDGSNMVPETSNAAPDTVTPAAPNSDVADAPETTFASHAEGAAAASQTTDEVPAPRLPKVGKVVIVRRRGKVDAPAVVVHVTPKHQVTAVVFYADHPLETVHNAREIQPSEKLTGWYWPEE